MSTTAQDAQAREVEIGGDRYRVAGDIVHIYFPPGTATGWVSNEKLEAAVRRVAELEGERDLYRYAIGQAVAHADMDPRHQSGMNGACTCTGCLVVRALNEVRFL